MVGEVGIFFFLEIKQLHKNIRTLKIQAVIEMGAAEEYVCTYFYCIFMCEERCVI